MPAADCSDDGICSDDIDTVDKVSSRIGWVIIIKRHVQQEKDRMSDPVIQVP